MRNGGRVVVTYKAQNLLPTVTDVDPPSVALKQRDPDGTETEILPAWPTAGTPIVKDDLGDFHWNSDPLDHAPGGTYTFVWKAPGWPELGLEVDVEPSQW